MKRRELLRDLFLAGGAFAVAGCLGGDGGGDGSSPDGTGTARTENGKPTTAGPAPTVGPATTEPSGTSPTDETPLANTTGTTETTGEPIPIPDAPAGGEKNTSVGGTARVTFRGNGSHIVVQGTIVGRDGCRTAVLESVRESESGLVVTVATERAATTGRACTMALVDIDYRFTIRRDSPPVSVTVVHRGATGERTVTTATR